MRKKFNKALFLADEELLDSLLLLNQVIRMYYNRMDKISMSYGGVSRGSIELLLVLFSFEIESRSKGGINLRQLGRELGKSKQVVSKLVKQSESSGLINIQSNVIDRRQKQITLSSRGKLLCEELLGGEKARLIDAYRRAGQQSIEGFIEVMKLLA